MPARSSGGPGSSPTTTASSGRSCATSPPGDGRGRAGNDAGADVLARDPDGVFLSNGPGDPAEVAGAPRSSATCSAQVPVFGICLGHQLLATALGAATVKLPFGHHGANHPVQDLSTGRIEITSQNHNFAVAADASPWARAHPRQPQRRRLRGSGPSEANAFSVQHHPRPARPPRQRLPVRSLRRAMLCRDRGGLMPRDDIVESVLVIGSGPIVIGRRASSTTRGRRPVGCCARRVTA